MKQSGIIILVLTVLFSIRTSSAQTNFIDPATGPVSPNLTLDASYKLEFSDEFNDNSLNQDKWTINVSSNSRAARPKLKIDDWWWVKENVEETDGNLKLKVVKHDHNTMYCGSVYSYNKYERRYGYYETSIKIADASKGTHTAFWLQGRYMGNVDGSARDGAEIDVFESAWLGEYTKSVVHIDGYGSSHQANTKQYATPGIHSGYHTWGLHWTKDFMNIYYDGTFKVSYTGEKWVVQEDEFLWLSDGASFGYQGDHFVNEPEGFLTEANVDYIRVWRQDDVPRDTARILLEAECNADKGIDWYYGEGNDASNKYYIKVNPAIKNLTTDPILQGKIDYEFNVAEPQAYKLYIRMKTPVADSGTFWYKFNNGPYRKFDPEEIAQNQWEWELVGQNIYLNQGKNNISLAFSTPGVAIDKLQLVNHVDNIIEFGKGAGILCTVDTSLNGVVNIEPKDTLSFEAEKGVLSGNSKLENCNNASGGSLVNLKDVGGVTIRDIIVKTGGEYKLTIVYLTSGARKASYAIDGAIADTITFASSGKWCFQGGGTAKTDEIRIELAKDANHEMKISPIGVNGPHIDKIKIEKAEEIVEPGLNIAERDVQFEVYPSMVDSYLTIESPVNPEKVEVFDMAGRSVYSKNNVVHRTINIATLKPGAYLVRIKIGGTNSVHRILKK